jgi:hypothetical protein
MKKKKKAVVEEIEELGKRSCLATVVCGEKPNLCSVHMYQRTCENTET